MTTPPTLDQPRKSGGRKLHTATLFTDSPFLLEDGTALSPLEVAYETWGTLNAERSNVVLVCHALTGDTHMASHGDGDSDGWWQGVVGKGRLLDPERVFIICANLLGSCYGTTGPNSLNPATGEKWGGSFPYPTMRDVIRVQKALLTHLGIERVVLVMGGSLGGQQTLQWAVEYPEFVGACVPMACNERASAWVIALQDVGRTAILNALRHEDKPELLDQALAVARMLAMISYRTPVEFNKRFERDELDDSRRQGQNFRFEVESYLRYQGKKLVERFEAHSYLRLTRILDSFDISSGFGSVEAALRRISCPVCLVGIDSDVLFDCEGPRRLAGTLRNLGKSAQFKLLESAHGHDAFLIEFEKLNRLLLPFYEDIFTKAGI